MATFTTNLPVNVRVGPFNFNIAAGQTASCPDDLIDEVIATVQANPGYAVTQLTLDRVVADTGLDYLDVTDYNVVGDDLTDNTVALQAFFNNTVTNGTHIYIPPGTYRISGNAVSVKTLFNTITGAGNRYGGCVIKQTTAHKGGLVINQAYTSVHPSNASPTIRGLFIQGAGGATAGRGFDLQQDAHLVDCGAAGFYDDFYVEDSSNYSSIVDCFATDADRAGVYNNDGNNFSLTRTRVIGQAPNTSINQNLAPVQYGCIVIGSLAMRITDCSFEECEQDGIAVDGGGVRNADTQGVVVSGCYFETGRSSTGFSHISLGDRSTSDATHKVKGVVLQGNYWQGGNIAGFTCVRGNFVDQVFLAGNEFNNGNTNFGAMNFKSSSTNVVLGPNRIESGGTTVPVTSIRLDPTSAIAPQTIFTVSGTSGSSAYFAKADHIHAAANGTTFPSNPAANDLFWRTDRLLLYYYDGTRWLTTEEFPFPMLYSVQLAPFTTATPTPWQGVVDEKDNGLWVTRWTGAYDIETTNNSANYWIGQLRSKSSTGANTNLGSTWNTSLDTVGQNNKKAVAVGAAVTAGHVLFEVALSKSGSPGPFYTWGPSIVYGRFIG